MKIYKYVIKLEICRVCDVFLGMNTIYHLIVIAYNRRSKTEFNKDTLVKTNISFCVV